MMCQDWALIRCGYVSFFPLVLRTWHINRCCVSPSFQREWYWLARWQTSLFFCIPLSFHPAKTIKFRWNKRTNLLTSDNDNDNSIHNDDKSRFCSMLEGILAMTYYKTNSYSLWKSSNANVPQNWNQHREKELDRVEFETWLISAPWPSSLDSLT